MKSKSRPVDLSLSLQYLGRDQRVWDWINNYTKRNKIKVHCSADRYNITFKSYNQLDCFVRNGNKNFPYFEFL